MKTRSFLFLTLIGATLFSIATHLYTLKKHSHDPTTHPKKGIAIAPVIIIGGGIGGLSAGIQLKDLKPSIFQGTAPGGQLALSHAVQNWPGTISAPGQEITSTLEEEASTAGCIFISEPISALVHKKSYFKIRTQRVGEPDSAKTYYAHSVLFAAGTTPNKLHVPGEDRFWGRGVSNCAICDGALYKGKIVAVIGGGEAALLEAQYLSTIAKEVYLIVRKGTFKSHEESRLAFVRTAPNIRILFNRAVSQIDGDGDRLTHIDIYDTSKKEAPAIQERVAIDGLFEAIGSQPNSSLVKKIVSCDEQGHIVVRSDFSTNVPGFFAIGDVTKTEYRQAIMVAQQASQAATSMQEYLSKKGLCQSTKTIYQPSHELDQHIGREYLQSTASQENCLIIGSGSAGMTAAIYLGLAGMKPLIIEGPVSGGSLTTAPAPEFWPSMTKESGEKIAARLKAHAESAGATLHAYKVVKIDTTTWPYQVTCVSSKGDDKKIFLTKSIIVTTNKGLNIVTENKITYNADGRYKTTQHFETSIPLIFAAGNAIADNKKHHVISAGQGAEAALHALEKIQSLNPSVSLAQQTKEATNAKTSKKSDTIPHLRSIKEYNQEVANHEMIVIDCFAQWCPPCRRLKPILENIYKENTYPKIHLYAVDVDEAEELSTHLEIASLPTLLFIKNGTIIKTERGFGGEARLHSLLENTFKKP